jgi:hypothetical protein
MTDNSDLRAYALRTLQNYTALSAYDKALENFITEESGSTQRLTEVADTPESVRNVMRSWSDLRYYYNAALDNNYDIFPYLYLIYKNRPAFEAIGANRTLAAADRLSSLFDEYISLHNDEAEAGYAFRNKHREAIHDATRSADGMEEFAGLLLSYADANFRTLVKPS